MRVSVLMDDRQANPVAGFQKRGERESPLFGKRIWVREVVNQNLPAKNGCCCPRAGLPDRSQTKAGEFWFRFLQRRRAYGVRKNEYSFERGKFTS